MTKLLVLILTLFSIASIYIYWPLWQELQGRPVDEQMMKRTQSAETNGTIDPTYTALAEATGGDVCFAGGNSGEEKTRNLQKCIEAFNHRDLVKTKSSKIRERFLNVKSRIIESYFLVIPLLYLFVFLIANVTRPVPTWMFSLAGALPGFAFWIYIGGIQAMSDPHINSRGVLNLPLAGAVLATVVGYFWFKNISDQSTYEKNLGALMLTLTSFIPCGFIILLARSC